MIKDYLSSYRKPIITIGLFLMLFPVLLNYMIFNWSVKSTNGELGSWIGFFASFYGAIFGGLIGGLFTFLGVKTNINHDKENKMIESYPMKIMKLYNMEKELFDLSRKLNSNKQIVYDSVTKEMIKGLLIDATYVNSKAFKLISEIDDILSNESLESIKQFFYLADDNPEKIQYIEIKNKLKDVVFGNMTEINKMLLEYQIEFDLKEK